MLRNLAFVTCGLEIYSPKHYYVHEENKKAFEF